MAEDHRDIFAEPSDIDVNTLSRPNIASALERVAELAPAPSGGSA